MEMIDIFKGDVVAVNLEPVKGSEQGGVRPCLVIQNNIANKYSPLTIVAAITSQIKSRRFITNVFLEKGSGGLNIDSAVLLNQIRTIDKSRITKKIGSLSLEIMKKVDLAINVSLDLN